MIRRYAVALAVFAAAPMGAHAADRLSYSYLDAQYLNTTLDVSLGGQTSAKDKREGMRAGISISLAPYLFFTTDYDQRLLGPVKVGASTVGAPSGIRWSYNSVGFGAHTTDRAYQLFGIATYEHNQLHYPRHSDQDDRGDGYGVEAGGRIPWNIFELHASYKYLNFGKTEFADGYKTTGARYGGGVLVQLTPWFALTGDWHHLDHTFKSGDAAASPDEKWKFDEWLVGFRSYFATDADKWKRHEGIFGTGEGTSAE